MAGRSRYSFALEFVKQLKGEGYDEIGLMSLREKMMMHLGSDERTLQKYAQLMVSTKLLKDMGIGCRFKIMIPKEAKKGQKRL